jgi:hypothetical protein
MDTNIVNDISKIYLEHISEFAVPGKPAERLGAVTAIPKSEQEAARERLLAKTKAKREAMKSEEKDLFGRPGGKYGGVPKKGGGYDRGYQAMQKKLKELDKVKTEALDPVGQEDSDIDNDGDTDKSDKYLHKRRKTIGKAIANRSVKEGFSNWREDLIEIMDVIEKEKKEEKITEKKVNNKIKINPNLGEAIENIGGTLLEMVEIDEVDFIVESVYSELLEEGYDEDDIEEAIEYALTEATVTYGHDTEKQYKHKKKSGAGQLVKAVGRLARQKLSSKVRGAKTSASAAIAKGARNVAKGALGVARKMEGDKKPSKVHSKSGVRTASTYSGAGAGTKEKVSSGSYTPPVQKKASEKPADPWKGSATVPSKPKPKPKAEKPADPWAGSATTPAKAKPKAATKKAAAPKAKAPAAPKSAPKKKRKSKLDDLLASVRSESVQIDEKTLTKMEMKKREEIVKSMKDKAADFEKRYPGRGKEVMYATATKMAKRVTEQMLPSETSTSKIETAKNKEILDKQKISNMKMLQQKQQILQKQKLQMQKSGKLPLGSD